MSFFSFFKTSGPSEKKVPADKQDKVIFGGRLGMYKYFDMHQVIEVALECAEKELNL